MTFVIYYVNIDFQYASFVFSKRQTTKNFQDRSKPFTLVALFCTRLEACPIQTETLSASYMCDHYIERNKQRRCVLKVVGAWSCNFPTGTANFWHRKLWVLKILSFFEIFFKMDFLAPNLHLCTKICRQEVDFSTVFIQAKIYGERELSLLFPPGHNATAWKYQAPGTCCIRCYRGSCSRRSLRSILPLADFGISLQKTTPPVRCL